jgi:hypothetical protein
MSDESTPKPIDFSALDPGRNQLRWERTIQEVAAQAHAERRHRHALERELLRWARPVLAVAAMLCLIAWTAGYVATRGRSVTAGGRTSTHSPALDLAAWVANDRIPDSSELLGTLGGNL